MPLPQVSIDDGGSHEQVRRAIADALEGGAPVAVLPAGPPAWQQAIRAALMVERPTQAALVVPTSGSTGRPRGVTLRTGAVTYAASQVVDLLGGPGSWLLALPLTHVAGLMVLARAVVSQTPVVATPASLDPAAVRDCLEAMSGRRYTALVPTQLHRLLEEDPGVLRSFDAVLVGGAALPTRLAERAARARVRVVESYGMTETCGGCVYDGVPLPGVRVAASDGRLAIAGPVLASSYRDPCGDVPVAGDGWFVTHDLGSVVDGRVSVSGRVDDVVTTGGVSVPLGAVDALLAEHPALADAVAVGVDDPEWGTRIVAVAVPRPGARPTLADVRSFVAEHVEPAAVPARLVLVDDLERPAPGKVDRRALAARVAGS
jgi:O-succinylbenzoic acid--CoA ligase